MSHRYAELRTVAEEWDTLFTGCPPEHEVGLTASNPGTASLDARDVDLPLTDTVGVAASGDEAGLATLVTASTLAGIATLVTTAVEVFAANDVVVVGAVTPVTPISVGFPPHCSMSGAPISTESVVTEPVAESVEAEPSPLWLS